MSNPAKEKSCGYQIRIVDAQLRAYLQRWPSATGPDPEKNIASREAVRQTLQVRKPGTSPEVVLLSPEQTLLSPQENQRLVDSFRTLQFDSARQQILINDFAWESNLVPRSARNVLGIGCGDGMELIFLRAILPEARITAIDYHDSIIPEVKKIVGLTFLEGDMDLHLSSLTGGYDLIFSNHTLEHLYMPDEITQNFHRLLAPGGNLISTLPMDGNPGTPFLDKVARIAAAKDFHPLDLVFLDAGHPWKTNGPDLNQTLSAAGFNQIRIYQRSNHLSRYVAGNRLQFDAGKYLGHALHALFFGVPRTLAKIFVPEKAQTGFSRILLAVERRVWFGTSNLKNHFTEEALVHASKWNLS